MEPTGARATRSLAPETGLRNELRQEGAAGEISIDMSNLMVDLWL